MTTGEKIKALRRAAGKTQKQCADAAKMAQSYWHDLEADKYSDVKVSTLERVAGALGTDIVVLLPSPADITHDS